MSLILPTPVQGDGADEKIAHAIKLANEYHMGDVIIVGRGGGSLEDLLPFSSEIVVRSIAASAIPVISAVGHETDVTLSDLVADLRAPTPSAAAEMVSASRVELLSRVRSLRDGMESALRQRTEKIRLLLGNFAPENLERNVRIYLQPLAQRADYAREEITQGMRGRITDWRHRYELATRELASYSPLLHPGTGLCRRDPGPNRESRSSSAEDARLGDGVAIKLAHGEMHATVEETDARQRIAKVERPARIRAALWNA